MNGIDLSYANDFSQDELLKLIEEKEIEFVILRLGYSCSLDDKLLFYISFFDKYEIPMGYYHFSYAYDYQTAYYEANAVKSVLRDYIPGSYFPLFLDFEYDSERYFKQKRGRSFTNDDYSLIAGVYSSILDCPLAYYCNLDYLRRFKFLSNVPKNKLWLATTNEEECFMRQETIDYKGKKIDINTLYDEETIQMIEGYHMDGWRETQGNRWRYFENGVPAIGWKHIDWNYFYFDRNGIMVTGLQEITRADGVKELYYFDENGKMCRTNSRGALES